MNQNTIRNVLSIFMLFLIFGCRESHILVKNYSLEEGEIKGECQVRYISEEGYRIGICGFGVTKVLYGARYIIAEKQDSSLFFIVDTFKKDSVSPENNKLGPLNRIDYLKSIDSLRIDTTELKEKHCE